MSTPPTSKGSSAINQLLTVLDLECLEDNLFRGNSPQEGWQRVYGGQVLGQALVAGVRTISEDRPVHSMHAYFLLPGDPTVPIVYEVERTRDGGSFSTRRIKAIQHGRTMFAMSASFHKHEESYEHQAEMPQVPPPEELPSAATLVEKMLDKFPENMRAYWQRERPVDMRPVDISRYLTREKSAPAQYVWIRANGSLPNDLSLHQCILAYASDFTLLDTALIAHGKLLFDQDIQLASLDHALWFHRPFRADEWLLYAQESPNANGARGLCRGTVFSQDGRLIATVAQEGLIRRRENAYVIK